MSHKPWIRLARSHMHTQNLSWCTQEATYACVTPGVLPCVSEKPAWAGLSFWTRAGHWSFCAWSSPQHRKPQGCLDRRWDTFNEHPVISRNETHSQRAHCTVCWCWLLTPTVQRLFISFFVFIEMCAFFLLQNLKGTYFHCVRTFSRVSL